MSAGALISDQMDDMEFTIVAASVVEINQEKALSLETIHPKTGNIGWHVIVVESPVQPRQVEGQLQLDSLCGVAGISALQSASEFVGVRATSRAKQSSDGNALLRFFPCAV